MGTNYYTRLLMAICLLFFFQQARAQYKTEQIAIDSDDYYGYVEVCKDCSFIRAEDDKEYTYLKDKEIVRRKGSYEGDLLQGRAFLFSKETNLPTLEAEFYLGQPHNIYKEWLSSGEPAAHTEYKFGVKNGKSFSYVFGVLESEETLKNGLSESVTYFTTEGKPSIKIDYIDRHGLETKIKTTYYGEQSLVEAEGIRLGDVQDRQITLYNGLFKRFDKKGKLLVKGNYVSNQKDGEWTFFLGDVVNTRIYAKDKLASEKFTKNKQPFTGIVSESFSDGKPKLEVAVKNGIREGKTLEYTKGKDRKPKVTLYKKGVIVGEEDLEAFMKKQTVLSEQLLKHECDNRGAGLYADKMQHTKDFTIVSMHFKNTGLPAESSIVFSFSPGNKTAFTLLDNLTNNKWAVKKVFQLYNEEHGNSLLYGEMQSFVLVFDRIPETTKNITLMEGDEPYTISETGEATYHWGCYDVVSKN